MYIITRLDPTNIYHHLEEYVTVFSSLAAIHDVMPQQVIIADNFIPGPFMDDFGRFSRLPQIWMRDLGRVCFKRAIIAAYSPASLLSYLGVGTRHTCPSLIMLAAAHWHRHLYHTSAPAFDPSASLMPKHVQGDMVADTSSIRLNVVRVTQRFFERALSASGSLKWLATPAHAYKRSRGFNN